MEEAAASAGWAAALSEAGLNPLSRGEPPRGLSVSSESSNKPSAHDVSDLKRLVERGADGSDRPPGRFDDAGPSPCSSGESETSRGSSNSSAATSAVPFCMAVSAAPKSTRKPEPDGVRRAESAEGDMSSGEGSAGGCGVMCAAMDWWSCSRANCIWSRERARERPTRELSAAAAGCPSGGPSSEAMSLSRSTASWIMWARGEVGLARSSATMSWISSLLAPTALPLAPAFAFFGGFGSLGSLGGLGSFGGLGSLGGLGSFGGFGSLGGFGCFGCGGGFGCSTHPFFIRNSRWTAEFQWFLTELSVRPGSSLAISAHLLPSCIWPSSSVRSSSSVQPSLVRQSSS
mmetsp:Transcript_66967/g.200070  ORF Transcript_66967/g.200070 Transcript_66967/m.200070 type:complete len:345 (+) Transcript_66967:233-1267(+)